MTEPLNRKDPVVKEYKKYDNDNPFFWVLIACFFGFWLMVWAGSRPTHFKPRSNYHVNQRR